MRSRVDPGDESRIPFADSSGMSARRRAVPSISARVAVSVGIGFFGAVLTAAAAQQSQRPLSDFGLVWAAARFLAQGINPYRMIGPGAAFQFQFPLNYPLTAAVTMLPFAWFSAPMADAIFFGGSSAALAWVLTRRTFDNPQLCVFASYGFLAAAANVQWSPLLTAAAMLPGFGILIACKPTVGLALYAAYPSRRALLTAGLFGGITMAIWPWWPAAWLSIIHAQTHLLAPVTLVSAGGPLVLLALAKWRRPEARLLVALACVPHSVTLYETVALFLIVETWTEGVILTILTMVLLQVQPPFQQGDYTAWITAGARWQVLLIYLPCLVMIGRRPNVWRQEDDGCRLALAALQRAADWIHPRAIMLPTADLVSR